MSLTQFKKVVDKEHLIGISLKSLNNEGLADRAFSFSPDTEITFDKDRTLVRLGFISNDRISKEDSENIISLLSGAELWNFQSEELLIGEVILKDTNPTHECVTIHGQSIDLYSFRIYLDTDKTVSYLLTLSFSQKRYLHGLSIFHDLVLSKTQLNKLIPLLINNTFGETPVLFRYSAKGILMNLTPTGLTDTIYVNPETDVWLLNTTTSRIGIDTEGSKGTVNITSNGYLVKIELKNKGTLEIYT